MRPPLSHLNTSKSENINRVGTFLKPSTTSFGRQLE